MSRLETRVETLTQTLVLHVPSPWDEAGLHWRSDRCTGRRPAYRWNVDVPEAPQGGSVTVSLDVAERQTGATEGSGSRQVLEWDGRDASGRLVVAPQPARVTISTAGPDGTLLSRTAHRAALGRPDARALGLGGLVPGDLHVLHEGGRTVFTGRGEVRTGVRVVRLEDGTYGVDTVSGRRHVFDGDGRHLRTVELRSDSEVARFTYEAGLLSEVVRGGTVAMRIERSDPDQVRLIGPAGDTLHLHLAADGTAAVLDGPLPLSFTATPDGLIERITDGTGFTRRYRYEDGRLVEVDAEASYSLIRTPVDGGFVVLRLSREGHESRVEVRRDGTGTTRTRVCCGARQATMVRIGRSGRTISRADGLQIETVTDAGGTRRRLRFPSGLEVEVGDERTEDGTRRRTLGDRGWSRSLTEDGDFRVTSPAGRPFDIQTDADGRPTRLSAGGSVRHLEYDATGRLSRIASEGGTLTILHDDRGRPARLEREDGQTTTFAYDTAGRLVEQVLPGDRRVRITYDAVGDIVGFAPPGRPPTRFVREEGQLRRLELPEVDGQAAAISIEYDADGLQTAWTRADGRRVEVQRGPGGRPTTLSADDTRVAYDYDPGSGALAAMSTADGVTNRMTWDGPLLSSVALEGPASVMVRLRHGADLLVRERTVGDRPPTSFEYDADGLLLRAGPMTIERDPVTGEVTARRVGQVEERIAYDERDRPREVVVTTDAGELLRRNYELDPRGRIIAVAESEGGSERTIRYAYDHADRLVEVIIDGVATHRFTYDANGNRLRDEGPDGVLEATVDARDRLHRSGAWQIEHTLDGELCRRWTDDREMVLTYDARSLLTGARVGATARRYVRDALGRVVAIGPADGPLTVLLYDELHRPVAAMNQNDPEPVEFVGTTTAGSPELVLAGDRVLRVVTDDVGSPRLVVDSVTGEIVQRIRFDPLGALQEDTNPGLLPFGFAGGLLDHPTGLIFFGVRAYDPLLQRWTTPDPLLFRGGMTNLYGYAHHDPVNHRDPTGTQVELCRADTPLWGKVGDWLGFEHWWLRTREAEAGMGAHPAGSSKRDTAITDHTGRGDRPSSTCDPVENVDEECVNAALALDQVANGVNYGTETGLWGPTNNCQDVVSDILDECALPGTEPLVRTDDDFVKLYSPSVDTAPRLKERPSRSYPLIELGPPAW